MSTPAAREQDSKSRRKRVRQALQSLALELLDLSPEQLQALVGDGVLLEALEHLRGLRARAARRRQIRRVAGLLSRAKTEPWRQALAGRAAARDAETGCLHAAERWRDRLMRQEEALAQWLQLYPAADTPEFRALLVQARKEYPRPLSGRAPRAGVPHGRGFRALFRELRRHLQGAQKC